MAMRPLPRPPIVSSPEPRGRTGLALAGSLLVAAGVVLAALAVHGTLTLPAGKPGASGAGTTSRHTATPTAAAVAPIGTAQANFIKYRDPQGRFALYVSSTWQVGQTHVTIGGADQAATTFAPAGSVLPDWTLAILPKPLADAQIIAAVNDLITTRGGGNLTPTNGPAPVTIGTVVWSRLDGTYQANGQTVQISVFVRPLGTGSALVAYESLPLMFDLTEHQNFQPMLQSLNFTGG